MKKLQMLAIMGLLATGGIAQAMPIDDQVNENLSAVVETDLIYQGSPFFMQSNFLGNVVLRDDEAGQFICDLLGHGKLIAYTYKTSGSENVNAWSITKSNHTMVRSNLPGFTFESITCKRADQ